MACSDGSGLRATDVQNAVGSSTISGSDGGNTAISVVGDGPSVVFADPLVVTDDPATTTSAVITAATGGTLSVTAADGTVFTLDVPADALEADATISAAAAGVAGIDGPVAVHAVHFEPAGLRFSSPATLRIQAPTAIAAGHAVPFQAASDGSGPQVAVIDDAATDDTAIVLLVNHFSIWGIGEIVDAISDLVVVTQSASAEAQLQTRIGQVVAIRNEIRRLGQEPSAALDNDLAELFIEYQDKVIRPLVESANATCDGSLTVAHATSNYLFLWMHNSLPGSIVSMKQVAETAFLGMERLCEDERIEQCLDSGDHTTLSNFWRNMNQWRARFNYARKPGDDPAQYEVRARKICKGYAYFISGGLQDFQVDGVQVCDVRKPFTLTSPGIATAEFSGGESLTGTYSATGAFNLSYTGTYTISLPAGPGEPGTMVGGGGGQIAGQAGSGTETYVLTPAYQVC